MSLLEARQCADTEHLFPNENDNLLDFDEGISYEGILQVFIGELAVLDRKNDFIIFSHSVHVLKTKEMLFSHMDKHVL